MSDDVTHTDLRGRLRADLVGQLWEKAMEGMTPEKFLADLQKFNPRLEFDNNSVSPGENPVDRWPCKISPQEKKRLSQEPAYSFGNVGMRPPTSSKLDVNNLGCRPSSRRPGPDALSFHKKRQDDFAASTTALGHLAIESLDGPNEK